MAKKYAIFTMDMEEFSDTGCVRESGYPVQDEMLDGVDEYIRLLDKHGIKATLFTVCRAADAVKAKMHQYVVRGHKIALHGYDHQAPLTMSNQQFRENIRQAKEKLEREFGVEILGYRAPFFSMDNERLDILKELGFRYDSSWMDFSQLPNKKHIDISGFTQILKYVFYKNDFFEFGIPCQKIFNHNFPISGGGYVRLGVWPFIRGLINQYIAENDYYVFYLHPFELSQQKVPQIKNLKLYDQYYLSHGLHNYRMKIDMIIVMLKKMGFEFVTFEEYMHLLQPASL